MNTFLVGAAAGGSNMIMIFAFLLLIAFTYFTMLRPQKKQNQKRMEMIKALKKGDQVVLISGLHGKIDEVNDSNHTVVIDADGIYLTFNQTAVRDVIPTVTTETTNEQSTEKDEGAAQTEAESTTDDEKSDN